MTPKELTNEILIGWGGAEVFNQALMLEIGRAHV